MANVHELKDPIFHSLPIGVVVTLEHNECQAVQAGANLLGLGVPEPYASVIHFANLALGALDHGNGVDIHVVLAPVQLVIPYPR